MSDMSDLPFPFPFVEAIYRTDVLPMYAGNPYIAALPALPSDRELARGLTFLPPFTVAERGLSVSQRIELTTKLQTLFVALPRVIDVARAMLKMLHAGYAGRAPFSAGDRQRLADTYAMQQAGTFASSRFTQLAAQHSMALLGSSGSGKSFTLRQIAGSLPPAIYHRQIGKWQLPFIFVEMSYDGESVHTLASAIISDLERLLPDGQFSDAFPQRRGENAEERLLRVLRAAYRLGVGTIVVDEVQNQESLPDDDTVEKRRRATKKAAKHETPLTKLLVTFSNTSHMPIMFTGTPESKLTVGNRFTRARRMSGRGSAVWGPLERIPGSLAKLADNPGGIGEFEVLFKTLLRYQWTARQIPFNDEWADVYAEFTQGIPDIMVKLHESVQVAAISNDVNVTKELVEAVFRREFKLVEGGIIYLKNARSNRLLLDVVTDLALPGNDLSHLSTAETPFPGELTKVGLTHIHSAKTPESNARELPASPSSRPRPVEAKARARRPEPPSPTPLELPTEALADADLRGAASKPGRAASTTVEITQLADGLGE